MNTLFISIIFVSGLLFGVYLVLHSEFFLVVLKEPMICHRSNLDLLHTRKVPYFVLFLDHVWWYSGTRYSGTSGSVLGIPPRDLEKSEGLLGKDTGLPLLMYNFQINYFIPWLVFSHSWISLDAQFLKF